MPRDDALNGGVPNGASPASTGAPDVPTDSPAAPPARPRSGARRAGLFVLAFGSGFAVLTIEIAGARLIAPVFGLSAVPWTAVIGVILSALALGSHLGGRLADTGRVPLAAVLAAAGFSAAIPVVGGGLPWLARDLFGFIPGAVASAVVLFAPPVLCLGAVVPYLVRADTESLATIGRRAGDVSAAATAGSIAGTFATGFILLPAFRLPVLLGLTGVALLAMAAVSGRILGGGAPGRHLALGAVGLGALGLTASRLPPGTLHAEQTLYASVRVTERTWPDGRIVREMWQNGGSSSAEYVDDGAPAHAYAVASLALLDSKLDDAESMLVLGGAALSLPVAFQRRRPELRVDVVEIDPVVTSLATRYFAYGAGRHPGVRVLHEDGRVFLRSSDALYDIVYLDVFDNLLTVPWTMVTVEALGAMRARLRPDGLFVANVLSPLSGPGIGFVQRFGATLLEVFEEVGVYVADSSIPPHVTQNLIVIGGRSGTAASHAERALARLEPSGPALTDAWAPVEYLQAKVLVDGLGWN